MVTPPAGESSPSDSISRDERLVALLDELTQRLHEGDMPLLDEVVREHPEFEEDLRELWGALVFTEEVARGPGIDSDALRTNTLDLGASDTVAPSLQGMPERIGEFRIIREIGRGGMGVVYLAEQDEPRRDVALKMLIQGQMAPAIDLARFRAEAEAAARLDHPHIVPVFEVGSHEGTPFFTLRYIPGESLSHRVGRQGPLSGRQAAEILAPICRAIHYAHSSGVLHRDLKPSNILLDEQGTPYVSDFGLAKRMEGEATLTQSGAILGTPSYMAPEQAQGSRGELSPQSDVYSLGAVLYFLVTGRPPFQASTPLDTVLAVLEQDPPPPRLLNPGIDRDLEMIIQRCLQKPPDMRYSSAEDLARDLEAYLRGDSLSIHSIRLGELFSRMLRSTHHAAIMENWGLLWMLHSVVVLVLCTLTNVLKNADRATPWNCLFIWSVGFGAWAAIFWWLRRRAGPLTFVEKQIAHIWGASILGSSSLFFLEMMLGLEALTLSPVLAIIGGMIFFAKGGILTGLFYVPSGVCFATTFLMAAYPRYDIFLFGLVTALSFFFPGLKYYRIRNRGRRREAKSSPRKSTS